MAQPKVGAGLVAGVAAGTLLEWYDAFLFVVAASYVGAAFFPSKNPLTELANVFLTFALGYFARPIGALLFGYIGDRYGRREAMLWTLTLAGLGTALIGVVPPYSVWGAAAIVTVVVLRLLQGLALGGEWGSAVNYLFENVNRKRLYMLFVQSGVPLGLLLAAGVMLALTAVLGTAATSAWGWRIAFLLSIIIVVIGLLFRISFGETFEYLEARRSATRIENPIGGVFLKHWASLIVGIFLAGAAGAVFYYGNTFLPNVANALGLVTAAQKFSVIILFAVLDLIGIVVSGFIAERLGNVVPITVGFVMFIIAALLIEQGLSSAAVMTALAALTGIAHGIVYTPEAAYLAELFPTLERNTGVSSAYQIGNTVIASTAPYVMTAILPYGRFWAGAYLALLAVIGLAGVVAYRPRR
ncbi:major facilitator superfamily MFS_1 [Thermoproteus uzoniensis 768-20]|uniref:Major facilitator superfamily MFS_1 n=1 Tax=Thermoproteus uzoniensis (strain 768-20) TaxID=999630 RepID=F2L5A5_THEU7|nr:MFS transporter [Thermoproteus uzoniensis]AEA13530.1 major facilitator superfamily MFS_1 [Thermoproteus uzoniensis 768-20]